MKKPLEGKVALVTGATRGIGKGIALQLAEAGAIVYITGRTLKSSGNSSSLEQTTNEIKERGGICIPVRVDHEIDSQIADLFKRIETEQNGRLDILVNSAYKASKELTDKRNLKFWEIEPEFWDENTKVYVRSHYFCTVYASRLMIPRKQGLIVNISSFCGLYYFFPAAYGIAATAVDRMAVDCGIELRKHNIAMLSLWLGNVKTELFQDFINNTDENEVFVTDGSGYKLTVKKLKEMQDSFQSVEFAGKCIVSLAQERDIMKYTSKTIIAEDYAQKKSINDIDNRIIPSFRQLNMTLRLMLPKSFNFLSNLIPNFIKIPTFLFDIMLSKFY